MNSHKQQPSGNKSETFGQLVKAYREQREWTQQELAARWGYTREYISQIERDKRKIDRADQVAKLASILDIPEERLEAIGRGLPKLAQREEIIEVDLHHADNQLLQMLLDQAQTKIKLSWLVWHADSDQTIVDDLANLIVSLEDAIANRRGTLLKPSLELLAHAHEMMGKIAFDKLDFVKASGHFQEMQSLGDEIQDVDIIAMAMIHQGDVFRRRGRYEQAIKFFTAAERFSTKGNICTDGLRWQLLARTYAEYGNKALFIPAIERAQEIVAQVQPNLDTTILQFNIIDVLQERAQGHTLLQEPEKAIELYQESDRIKPFRPMRDLGVFIILQAQAHSYAGDLDRGVKLAIQGLQLARSYNSERHVSRVQRMYDRLSVTKVGTSPKLQTLKEALASKK